MASTLKDVAVLAGVHPSTVSRVLRGKENIPVSAKTRKRIFDAVNELNYRPDKTARALRLRKSDAVGLVIPNIASPYFSGIAKTLDILCHKAGYSLMIYDTNENQEKEIQVIEDLLGRGVDGLIIAPVQDADEHIRQLVAQNVPLVLIDRDFETMETHAVICDDELSSYRAVSYLSDLGHRRIGFISGRQNLYPVLKRLDGYRKALTDLNLEKDPAFVSSGGPTLESGYSSALTLLSLPNAPTALLISGTIITVGALKAIQEKGLSIPEDISIISYTDTIYAPFLSTPITTISHSMQEIAEKAFELLHQQMDLSQKGRVSKVIVQTHLHKRASTAPVM
ncbi:MAG: LacI family transcriptional regulator [Calditrichaeota bacterium]|nr:LacI family transcriptional regulator [Calditrichota bacterium]